MGDISRRTALSLLFAAAPVTLISCAPVSPVAQTPTAVPTPTPTPTSLAATSAPRGSLVNAEFGPTGAHWPTRTPLLTDDFDVVVEADCNWTAIGNAIKYVDERSRELTGCVLVKPGVLPGFGAGSSSSPVLQLIGSAGRSSRVVVTPRDGISSVSLEDSIRIDRVIGVSFIGFWTFPNSLVLTSVQDFAWARSKGRAFNITGGDYVPAQQVELVECVTPEAQVTESDAWAFRTGDNAVEGISVVGCYIAPSYKPDGSKSHCDTLQLSGNPLQDGITITDSVIFASTNAAFIPSSNARNVVFDHTLIVAGDRMLQRYPLSAEANAFTSGLPAAVNGAGSVGILSARNSTLIGNLRGEWATVTNTMISADASRMVVQNGSFTTDFALASIDTAWLESKTPMPTDERLLSIWGGSEQE
ncbi:MULTISPECIES: hypothetical protein [Microbacterium]|uniref:Uncharacterized protein n=1 Tax=Microbacterium marmarense TaxID=3122051 RepID=A0ABU8LQW9_9MICO